MQASITVSLHFMRRTKISKTRRYLFLTLLWLLLATAPISAQSPCANPYQVKPGDGWIKIAGKCGITYEALRTANPDLWQQRQERLHVGDSLQIPSGAPPFPTTPAPTVAPSPTAAPSPSLITPLETVRRFWIAVIEALRTGDFRPAYLYLTPDQQRAIPYAIFQATFAGIHEVTITSIAVVQEGGGRALVDAVIVTANRVGPTGDREWHRYSLIPIDGQWRIESMLKLDVDPSPEPRPTTNPCTGAPATRLQRGQRAYVLPQPPLPNRVFREPNRQSPLVGRIPPNEAMTLLDGPRCGQGSVWWYVQADNGAIGWTAEGQTGEYWLAPVATSDIGVVSPILFCTQLDNVHRCFAPTTHFPIGLKRLEVNWHFQKLPLNTPIRHLWYHNGVLFHQRPHVIWPANRHSTSGMGYTFYAPLGGLPTGEWRLEFRLAADNRLLQTGLFTVGPSRR
jgi:hypothetical protein